MTARHAIPLLKLVTDAGLQAADIFGNPDIAVTAISTHAQGTPRNGMFVAITGTRTDSHMLLGEAVAAGASVIVVERDTMPYPGVTTVRVPNTRYVLGPLAHAFHGNATRRMRFCGVTGTNGKTTTTHLITQILRTAGCRTGLIGTLGAYHQDGFIPLDTTTPGPLQLAQIIAEFEKKRVDSVVMEVSSHAVDQGRVNGIPFRAGALTGVTQDHLDYHGDFPTYVGVKRRFFFDHVAPTPGSVAAFNFDDPVGEEMTSSYLADSLSFTKNADARCPIRAIEIAYSPKGSAFTLEIEGKRARVETRMVGAFNVTNMLAAATCSHVLGVSLNDIAEGLRTTPQVPGRFEFIDEGQPFSVVVDYAHTPDALDRVLRSARRLCQNRLIVVFGCGGDRDRGKRPLMGKCAGDSADFVIVTSDNPRSEEPSEIARQVLEGVLQSALKSNRYQILLDRRHAITAALTMASPGDVVVIAGKGHEDYQDIGIKKLPFDDREISRATLREIVGNFSQQPALEPTTEGIL